MFFNVLILCGCADLFCSSRRHWDFSGSSSTLQGLFFSLIGHVKNSCTGNLILERRTSTHTVRRQMNFIKRKCFIRRFWGKFKFMESGRNGPLLGRMEGIWRMGKLSAAALLVVTVGGGKGARMNLNKGRTQIHTGHNYMHMYKWRNGKLKIIHPSLGIDGWMIF